MTDELFRQVLSSVPAREEIEVRSDRARRRALASLDGATPARSSRHHWVLAFAASLAVLVPALVFYSRPHQPPVPAQETAKSSPYRAQPLQLHLTLSDGTTVVWVFDDRSAM